MEQKSVEELAESYVQDFWFEKDEKTKRVIALAFRGGYQAGQASKALPLTDKALEQEQTNHLHTRMAWDRTIQERDDLINQVKALTAIKTGLETSLKEALLPTNDWVSVGNLPDYDEPVLWLLEDGNMVVEDLDKDGNPWLFGGTEADELFPTPKATHWRRLPEKPDYKKAEGLVSQPTQPDNSIQSNH